MGLLPHLRTLQLVHCPNLRALPPEIGQATASLKLVLLRHMPSLKAVENLPFLSEWLSITDCEGLERVENLPRLTELCVRFCPNLRQVEELGSLEQLWLDVGMQDLSTRWVPRLKHQRQQVHGEDLDVYTLM